MDPAECNKIINLIFKVLMSEFEGNLENFENKSEIKKLFLTA